MPRKARLNVPGAIYHVMSRCLPMYQLFQDDTDRDYFLTLLSTGILSCEYKCYAWVLMDNHYHLVLRSGNEPLWRLMKPLQMRYAQYHGRKTGRKGPLFMDRFKSIVTQDQNYIEELIRYVHLNPIRAGICKDIKELHGYRWSGHRNLVLGTQDKFQDVKNVLLRFGKTDSEAKKSIANF
jgi:putative transposase